MIRNSSLVSLKYNWHKP